MMFDNLRGRDARWREERLTSAGRKALAEEEEGFRLFTGAMEQILDTT